MELKTYIRKPFPVEATEITLENIEEIASIIGVVKVEDGRPFIEVDKKLVPSIQKAYLGWYFTIMGTNYRCFRPTVFEEQFEEQTAYFTIPEGVVEVTIRDDEILFDGVPINKEDVYSRGGIPFPEPTSTTEEMVNVGIHNIEALHGKSEAPVETPIENNIPEEPGGEPITNNVPDLPVGDFETEEESLDEDTEG